MILILMGVTASGKSTVGQALARLTGWNFAEGDDYHSEANRKKMHSGIPLDDHDRAPWLAALHQVLLGWQQRGENGILTCSALKQKYRDTLTDGMPPGSYRFVLLEVPEPELRQRLLARSSHFMNPALLESQLATLEQPKDALRVASAGSPDAIAGKILAQVSPN
jgi:gluconokinase